jgi:hypothetical protein
MFLHRGFLVIGLSLLVVSAASAAPTINRRQRGNNGIEGTVVQVHHDRLHRNVGWIKVRHGTARYYGRRRGTSALAAATRHYGGQVMMFHVNSSTRFQRLAVRGRGVARLGFGSIHRGQRVRVYLGSQRVARLVDIFPNSSYRTRHRSVYPRRYGSRFPRRYVYNRHPLIHNRVLVRTRRHPVRVNHPVVVNRPVVVRTVPHPLIQGRVAVRRNRQVVVAQAGKPPTAKPKTIPPKHPIAHKPTPPKQNTTHKPAAHPGHSASHPHSSSHRKK